MNSYQRNNQTDAAMIIIAIVAILCGITVWKIHKATGLSFDALASVGRNLLLFFGALGAIIFFKAFSVIRHWNWAAAAFWLALTPAFSEWGGGSIEEGFRHFSNTIEPQWYAQTIWQLVVAAGIASSKYIYEWVTQWIKGY